MTARAQTAMEYLSTYGWAFIVVAIVVFALYASGVFGGNVSSLPTACVAQGGFLCAGAQMNTTGNVLITFGEALGVPINITGTACVNTTNAPSSFISASTNILPGQKISMIFQCPLSSNAIGTAFQGTLWVQYTKQGETQQVSKIGILTAKATTANSLGLSGGGGNNPPSRYPYSVSITLSNANTTTATPSPFQQMLSIDSATYSSYINSNWMNVEFTTGNYAAGTPGTTLQAWVESNATNSSTNTIVWVKLPFSIGASSSNTIYIDFLSSNVMSASGPTGEAPQLSSTYAQYDNGADVFNYYQAWGGLSSLPAGWTNGGATMTYNPTNTQISVPSSSYYMVYNQNAAAISIPEVWEFYGNAYSLATSGGMGWGLFQNVWSSGSYTAGTHTYALQEADLGSAEVGADADWGLNGGTNTGFVDTNALKLYTIAVASGSSVKDYVNYAPIWSSSAEYSFTPAGQVFANHQNSYPYTILWSRTRAYPPGGVMPGLCVSASPTILASISPSSIFQGQSLTLSSSTSCGTSPYTYQWYEEAPGASSYSAISGATSSSYNFQTTSNSPGGTYSFEVKVTDSNNNQATSSAVSATVISGTSHILYVANQGSNNVIMVDSLTNSTTNNIESSVLGAITSGFSQPYAVSFSPDGTRAYVANGGSNNVVIVNSATNTVTGSINTFSFNQPWGVAYSPSGTYAYVPNWGTHVISIINTATNIITGQISSGMLNALGGTAFSPSGTYAYVANEGANNVVIVDTATNTVTGAVSGSISCGGLCSPYAIAFSPTQSSAYVAYSGGVAVISTATNAITSTITSGFNTPWGVAYSPSGTYAYVANNYAQNVVIINTATNMVVNAIASGFSYPRGIAFSPSGTYAYIANSNSNNVVIINTATNTVTGAIASGFYQPYGISFSPSGTYAYVANNYANNVVIVNTASNSVASTISAGFSYPAGIAFSHNGAYAYVANQNANNVVVVNTATNTVVSAISGGFNSPTGVAAQP